MDDIGKKIADKLQEERKIFGKCRQCVFTPDKKQLFIQTHSRKFPNFYLYDCEQKKVLWERSISFTPDTNFIFFSGKFVMPIARGSGSFLKYHDTKTGEFLYEFTGESRWTNIITCKKGIIAGCRDGCLYMIDQNAKLIKKFLVKDPDKDYGNPYNTPSPFNITMNKTEDYIAFSHLTRLYLLDSNFNLLWRKDMDIPHKTEIPAGTFFGFTSAGNEWAYKVLEINRNSDAGHVKKAFRKMALKWHPDKHSESNKKIAEEKFKEVINAYETISGASSEEIDRELEKFCMSVTISFAIFDCINKIEFIKGSFYSKERIKVCTANGIEAYFEISGEYLE